MASSDSSLAGLTTNAGALLPAFASGNPGPYTAPAPSGVAGSNTAVVKIGQ